MNTQQPFTQSWKWRCGFLALLLLLLVWNLWGFSQMLHSQSAGRFSNLIVCLMLVLNHVSAYCIPPGRLKSPFQWFATAWLVFGCAYVFTSGFSGFLFQ
jgi:hypothetical protein